MCRSEQTLNELLGGSTISKIKTEITNSLEHNQKNLGIELTEPYHDIYLKENSIIKRIFQNDVIKVNSWHSQAVNEVGKGLIVTAKAQDGVIEVIESTEKDFVLLLQFHPEEMAVKDKKWDKIFLEFKSYVEKYNEKGDQKW